MDVTRDRCCGGPTRDFMQGDRVHRTQLFEGTRVGGAERYMIAYISSKNVIVRAYRLSDNTFISEEHLFRSEFNDKFELCPGV